MNKTTAEDLARKCAANLNENWSIGVFSQFCEEPADFDRPTEGEVESVILTSLPLKQLLEVAQAAKELEFYAQSLEGLRAFSKLTGKLTDLRQAGIEI